MAKRIKNPIIVTITKSTDEDGNPVIKTEDRYGVECDDGLFEKKAFVPAWSRNSKGAFNTILREAISLAEEHEEIS